MGDGCKIVEGGSGFEDGCKEGVATWERHRSRKDLGD